MVAMEEWIFPFNDKQVLQFQDNDICRHLYQDFSKRVQASSSVGGLDVPIEKLSSVFESDIKVHFFARYGSAVVLRPLGTSNYETVVSLIGLDGWKSVVHASRDADRQATAVPNVTEPAFFPLGAIIAADCDELLQQFGAALAESEGEKGNHKTPSFARTVMYQTMLNLNERPDIQGGTTDVGLHTGCILRNTSFPLVMSLVHELFKMEGEPDSQVFLKCISVYLLSYLESAASNLESYDEVAFDRVITIIRELQKYLPRVQDAAFKETVLAIVKGHRLHLDDLRPGKDYQTRPLQVHESVVEICSKLRAPTFPDIPDLSDTDDPESRMARARSDAEKNLGYTGRLQNTWVRIARLNVYFWGLASELGDESKVYDITALRKKLLRFFKHVSYAREKSVEIPHITTVVMSSEELLAAWICQCWAHRTAEEQHPLFLQYGTALDPADLQHIALADSRSIEAVECVRRFLKLRARACRLFQNKKDTLSFAKQYGLQSSELVDLHSAELKEGNRLLEERWRKIEITQQQLAVLDGNLRDAKKDLERAELRLQESADRDLDYNRKRQRVYHRVYHEREAEENRCESVVDELASQIRRLEAKPSDLFLGLPRLTETSVQWLFFLFMPTEFRDLSALSQIAQSMLWEKPPIARSSTQNLLSWFDAHRKMIPDDGVEAELMLGSNSDPPRRLDTRSIRYYSRETGVFFPDSFSIDPRWVGTDPFVSGRTATETTKLFTERLPRLVHRVQFMQTFVPMLPTSTRENEGIARREKKPDWLTQEQYGAFTTLRAAPYAQIRCLVEVLHDNLLPFEHVCVHILIKQLLFHIGEGWKIDLDPGWNGFDLIVSELRRQVDLLRDSPKDCDRLLLFGTMSSFFGQDNVDCRACAQEFARISQRWADEVGREVKADQVSPSLYWKQAKLYGYALFCHSYGRLEESDCLRMAKLIVLFRNKALFASDVAESSSLDQPVLQVMAYRITGILRATKRCLERLSECLSLVLDDVPEDLQWSSVADKGTSETACFEAESSAHLYSINLLNGTVLIDGVPPGLLPACVVTDDIYKRTFGSRNFEMAVLGFRHYRTARFVDDEFLYEFVIDASDQLHIFELNNSNDEKLVLLQKDELDLPLLLRERHSHWFSELHDVVILRKPSHLERCVEFVITEDATYCLPLSCGMLPVAEIADERMVCDRLVLGETTLSKSLQYFEAAEYIHITVSPEDTSVHYSLPRYNLSFSVRDDTVSSMEFKGFWMSDSQVLKDTLPRLKACIVLSHADGREKVLIPEGKIHKRAQIDTPKDWRALLGYHIYDVHRRFRHLIAGTMVGRLHLAGLYASSCCSVADRRMGKPGTTIASELVRQSWKNEPLTVAEQSKLVEVSGMASMSCTLSLLCSWLWKSSNSVAFLHGTEFAERNKELDLDVLALDEYNRNMFAPRLIPCEELTLLGTRQPRKVCTSFSVGTRSETLSYVEKTEHGFRSTYVVEAPSGEDPLFPLNRPSGCTGLERKVYDELEESYDIFHSLPQRRTKRFSQRAVEGALNDVLFRRENMEVSILRELNDGDRTFDHRLSQLSGATEMAAVLDILRMVCDDSIVELFVPFVSPNSQRRLRLNGVDWAALCVLEDKLQRILAIEFDVDPTALLLELESVREWDPAIYPRWLAFEVEQNLQIRPHQYSIIRQLLDCPSSAIQLNMGLGKTRVLVPMLIMEYMSMKSTGRINMLPPIINEAMEYYRNVLVASVQHAKLYSLPFHRGIPLDAELACRLGGEIVQCKEHQGSFVVTAQQRNSLLLKQYDQDVFVEGLNEDFVDILDESDAILHHDFQLVYALGAQVPLPSGPCRWTVLQALLAVLSRSNREVISKVVHDASMVHTERSICGSFPKIRLLLPFKGHAYSLGVEICRELVTHPPYELRWMKEMQCDEAELLVSIMSNPAYENSTVDIETNEVFQENKQCILAARGFVAFGLLFHGLEGRFRVHYGLNPQLSTKMAVPYAASDTPKPRSQFSHPDMCIVYTALSYFHEGLNRLQLKEALLYLQSMGIEAQKAIYGEWISSIRSDVALEDLVMFDDPNKVDVSNAVQFDLLYGKLRNCMEVVGFWTNNFVYPNDTFQFPEKRATSAWNICDSGKPLGFSGTDDNRFLLPQSISQIAPDEDHLRATNGEMIKCILDCTTQIEILKDESPMWQGVLSSCIALRVRALIDVAGLMAGSPNEEASVFLSERLDSSMFRGVVYFSDREWMVYETDNGRSVPLHSSSFTEADCFVYFDESRCRGSDMKLQNDAVALVTLDPKMTKDKLMQGCARMRKLRPNGQSLILAGTAEVLSIGTTTEHVLETILHHTVITTKRGVATYHERGYEYDSFPQPTKDDFSLEQMYASAVPDYASLTEYLDATHENETLSATMEKLVTYCKSIGKGTPGGTGQLSQECEQELEREVDCEEEEEMQIAKQDPYSQVDWSFELAFSDPESLFATDFVSLDDFIRQRLDRLSAFKWSAKVYCTQNFLKTIAATDLDQDLSQYLRPVNSILVMPDGRIVLISAYELDKLLPIWWKLKDAPKATLHHLCICSTVSTEGFGRDSVSIPDETMAFAKLFRGYVQYTKSEKTVLANVFCDISAPHLLVQDLLVMRSRLSHFERSDLQNVATRLYR